jgi:hypothetical protein
MPEQACCGYGRVCAALRDCPDAGTLREQAGIHGPDAAVSAMAAGLVTLAWQQGPVERMRLAGRGPDDAALLAESASLHDRAVSALTAQPRARGLAGFRNYLLDRRRPWSGTGGQTLRQLGYGCLASYDQHVRDEITMLLRLDRHTCIPDPLAPLLTGAAILLAPYGKGMPAWPVIAGRTAILIADPDHPAWGEDGAGKRAIADMPPGMPAPRLLTAALLASPSVLPRATLQWLTRHLLHSGGPPYRSATWDT